MATVAVVETMVGMDEGVSIIRVFPRRTNATPTDEYAFIGDPPLWWPEDADEVRVSVTFTWDLGEAYRLAGAWSAMTRLPTTVGGPGAGTPGGLFTPGLFLKPGCIITSRGCPNHCWFCKVWVRDGRGRELPIFDGWNVMDDNLLACSEQHIRTVIAMLKAQPRKARFTGGLEAKRLEGWHVDLLADLKPERMYFAYDTADDLEPLQRAGTMLREAGFREHDHDVCAYVLIGYPRDSFDAATTRLRATWEAGFFPFAMLYRDERGEQPQAWTAFQRQWARPQLTAAML